MRNERGSTGLQNLPPALRPGGSVRARGASWQVQAVRAGADCLAIDLKKNDVGMRRRTLLYPFDRVVPIDTLVRSRWVSRRRWAAALLGLLDDDKEWAMPRAAVGARIDVLPYQLQPLLAVLQGAASRLLIADAVGLGKTIEAGLILAELFSRGIARRGLVITPAGLRHQWVDELLQRFAIASTVADAGWLARRAHELPASLNPWTLPGCYVTSIDFLKQPEVLAAARQLRWDLLVVDEAHLAATGTDRGAAVHDLASRSQWVVLLSATPHDGSDERFAALCRTGRVGTVRDSLLVFRRLHGAGDIDRVTPRIRVLAVRPAPAEAHTHALLTRYGREVWASAGTSGGEGARLAISVLFKRAFSSMHALERSVRRRQQLLAAEPVSPTQQRLPLVLDEPERGSPPDDEEPDAVLAAKGLASGAHERAWLGAIAEAARIASQHESKLALVRRLLVRTHEPLLLFTEFRDTLSWIARAIGRMAPTELLHGGQTERERAEAIARFSSGHVRVLLATDAAALGLNLQQRCRLVVNLEVPWNPNRVAQRVGRLARIGQRRRVHALMLVARGTGEARVLDVFDARQRNIRASLGATPREQAADVLAIGATILSRDAPAGEPDGAPETGHSSSTAGPAVASIRHAGSTFAAEAHRCASAILARRELGPASPVVTQLARRRPWVTRLRLRGDIGPAFDGSAGGGLVLVRVRLVDSFGHPWASTLVPLALCPRHPISRAKGASWHEIIDQSRATLESEAHRRLERWVAQTRASISAFARQVGSRATAIDARILADRRRTPHQPGLFASAMRLPLCGNAGEDDAAAGWLVGAETLTLECEIVLVASVRVRPPSAGRAGASAGPRAEKP